MKLLYALLAVIGWILMSRFVPRAIRNEREREARAAFGDDLPPDAPVFAGAVDGPTTALGETRVSLPRGPGRGKPHGEVGVAPDALLLRTEEGLARFERPTREEDGGFRLGERLFYPADAEGFRRATA